VSPADWMKWDLTIFTCARTWYWFECVLFNVGHCFSISVSRSPLCVPRILRTNVGFLHSSVPVRLYNLPVWGLSWYFRNESRCITCSLQVDCTHKRPSIPHIQLPESAHFKYMTCEVWVSQLMDAATAGDHRVRCRHCLRLQLPLPLAGIPFSSSCSQRICNDSAGFWIRDGGRHVIKTAGMSRSASNDECRAGLNVTLWVCLWGSSRCWCATTAWTQHGCWSRYWPSLCSGRGGCHVLNDICNLSIVQQRWEGGVLNLEGRGYGTPSLRGIPLASRYWNASLRMGTLRIPRSPRRLLILTISKSSIISYARSRVRVKALGSHSQI